MIGAFEEPTRELVVVPVELRKGAVLELERVWKEVTPVPEEGTEEVVFADWVDELLKLVDNVDVVNPVPTS